MGKGALDPQRIEFEGGGQILSLAPPEPDQIVALLNAAISASAEGRQSNRNLPEIVQAVLPALAG